jgi:hypothetical protein
MMRAAQNQQRLAGIGAAVTHAQLLVQAFPRGDQRQRQGCGIGKV